MMLEVLFATKANRGETLGEYFYGKSQISE